MSAVWSLLHDVVVFSSDRIFFDVVVVVVTSSLRIGFNMRPSWSELASLDYFRIIIHSHDFDCESFARFPLSCYYAKTTTCQIEREHTSTIIISKNLRDVTNDDEMESNVSSSSLLFFRRRPTNTSNKLKLWKKGSKLR